MITENWFANIIKQPITVQMKITDFEIENRKALIGFTQQDAEELCYCRNIVVEELSNIMRKLYSKMISIHEIALMIGDVDSFCYIQKMIREYVLEIFSGQYDQEYVKRRLRIGLIHKRIRLTPKFYFSMLNTLQLAIMEIINKHFINNRTPEKLCLAIVALQKILAFDVSLAFDSYVMNLTAEIELAQKQTDIFVNNLEKIVTNRTEDLEKLSRIDGLTKLFNYRSFNEHLHRELEAARREQTPLTLIFLDIDGFKKINDIFGHLEGDRILSMVGKSFLSITRKVDISCRYGGDEFCVIMPRATENEAKMVTQRIINNFSKENKKKTTFSVGIFQTGPKKYFEADKIIKKADNLMYEAKKEPGFQIRSFSVGA